MYKESRVQRMPNIMKAGNKESESEEKPKYIQSQI